MNKILVIANKELQTYFKSPIAYLVLIITTIIFNVFFFLIIDQNREATLRDIFQVMEFMFVFIIPLLTMKAFAEEKATGTIEFLMTTPTTNTVIVLGKYIGCLIFFTVLMSITAVYYVILEIYAVPDRGAIFIGYLGSWLEGALFIAIGLMTSSWTKNQIIAAMSAYLILFSSYFSITSMEYCKGTLQAIVRYYGTWSHAENLFSGVLSTADVVYYVSGIIFILLLTRLFVENRLWR